VSSRHTDLLRLTLGNSAPHPISLCRLSLFLFYSARSRWWTLWSSVAPPLPFHRNTQAVWQSFIKQIIECNLEGITICYRNAHATSQEKKFQSVTKFQQRRKKRRRHFKLNLELEDIIRGVAFCNLLLLFIQHY